MAQESTLSLSGTPTRIRSESEDPGVTVPIDQIKIGTIWGQTSRTSAVGKTSKSDVEAQQ